MTDRTTPHNAAVPAPGTPPDDLVQRYHAASAEDGSPRGPSPEANARVLAEGMRRAGPKLDRESVTAGLESMNDFDLGGLRIRYGKDAREGNSYTDIITVAQNGQIIS